MQELPVKLPKSGLVHALGKVLQRFKFWSIWGTGNTEKYGVQFWHKQILDSVCWRDHWQSVAHPPCQSIVNCKV